MGGEHGHDANRVVGAAEQWLGTVQQLAPDDVASISFRSFAPVWSPSAVALGYFLGGGYAASHTCCR